MPCKIGSGLGLRALVKEIGILEGLVDVFNGILRGSPIRNVLSKSPELLTGKFTHGPLR